MYISHELEFLRCFKMSFCFQCPVYRFPPFEMGSSFWGIFSFAWFWGMQRIEFCITIGTQDKTRTLIHECTAHVGLMLPFVQNNVMTSASESSHASIEILSLPRNLQLLVLISPPLLACHALVVATTSCHIYNKLLSSLIGPTKIGMSGSQHLVPFHATANCRLWSNWMDKAKRGPWFGMYQIKKEAKDVTGCVLECTLYDGLAMGDTGLMLISMRFTSSDVHCSLWRCSQCLKRSILFIGPLHQKHSSLLRLRPTIESLPSERF